MRKQHWPVLCVTFPHLPITTKEEKVPWKETGWCGSQFRPCWTWHHSPNLIPCHFPSHPPCFKHTGLLAITQPFSQGLSFMLLLLPDHSSPCYTVLHMTGFWISSQKCFRTTLCRWTAYTAQCSFPLWHLFTFLLAFSPTYNCLLSASPLPDCKSACEGRTVFSDYCYISSI